MIRDRSPGTDASTSGWVGGPAARDGWGRRQGIHSPQDRRFVGLAAAALDDFLARDPVVATSVGDERFDSRLPDYTADGVAEQVRVLNRHLLALESLEPIGLSRVNAVDLSILRRNLRARVYRLRTLDEPRWNPSWWSPARALEPLFAREHPPVRSILARLNGLTEHLESARHSLVDMPRPHLELALAEAAATPEWLAAEAASLGAAVPSAAAELQDAARAAAAAITEHRRFLASRLGSARRDPRLGPRRYGEVLHLMVGTNVPADEIRRRAEEELAQLTEQMRSIASRVLGRSIASRRLVPNALAWVAAEFALPSDGLAAAGARSVAAARAFTIEQKLVSVPEVAIDVVRMPAVRAGRSAVFSETPGPLARGARTARIAMAGPEADWSPARRDSFLREYNALMIDAVMAHQAVPGHVLQAAHAEAANAPTEVRAVFPDRMFSEGWAIYAQDLLMRHGYPGSADTPAPEAFALQQTKLRMRAVVNALLDIGFHTGEMDEPQARRLVATSSMAEEGEAVVKWRRVQTSAGDLTNYLLGHEFVSRIVRDLQTAHPDWPAQRVHDRVLMHGAVPPAAAVDLLGLA